MWDPMSVWPKYRLRIWSAIALWACITQGPPFLSALTNGQWRSELAVPDFFQEWSSARNFFTGQVIYEKIELSTIRYLGLRSDPRRSLMHFNAHPPVSVLLALPFAGLDFDTAFSIWNLASLGCFAASFFTVAHHLRIKVRPCAVAPAAALLLLCGPFREQVRQGQLSLILLALVTAAWSEDRRGRPIVAGIALGLAASLKLFPGFLLLYYALQGRRALAISGLVTFCAANVTAAAFLGGGAFTDYVWRVVPEFAWFRVAWNNASLAGFFSKLFDPVPAHPRFDFWMTLPAWYSPKLALTVTLFADVLVVFAVAWASRRSKAPPETDRAFGIACVGMLLVSPITWEHGFLLLLVPLAVLWSGTTKDAPPSLPLILATCALWSSPWHLIRAFGLEGQVAHPWHTLTILSYQSYALIVLLILLIIDLEDCRRWSGHPLPNRLPSDA